MGTTLTLRGGGNGGAGCLGGRQEISRKKSGGEQWSEGALGLGRLRLAADATNTGAAGSMVLVRQWWLCGAVALGGGAVRLWGACGVCAWGHCGARPPPPWSGVDSLQ